MATYRPVHVKIWDDPDFQEYDVVEKLLFLYLVTNRATSESGIYPLSLKTIAGVTGIELTKVKQILQKLKNVSYDFERKCVFVENFIVYNRGGAPELREKAIIYDAATTHTPLWNLFIKRYPRYAAKILEVMKNVKDIVKTELEVFKDDSELKNSIDGNDENNNKGKNEELPLELEEGKKVSPHSAAEEFMSYFNSKCKEKFEHFRGLKLIPERIKVIEKRLKEGHELTHLYQAVDNFVQDDWDGRRNRLDVVYCIGIRSGVDNLEKWMNWKVKVNSDSRDTSLVNVSKGIENSKYRGVEKSED